MKNEDIYITDNSIAINYINRHTYPYEVLPNIFDYIIELGNTLDDNYIKQGKDIWVHKTAHITDTAKIVGPCIIDSNANIRHCAYIRGNVIIGKNTIIGNSSEIKNSIIFDDCSIPHFNYVGDSIIGYHVHLSAGVITSNLKIDGKDVKIDDKATHLRKVGSFIGDNVEIGCNTVLNPGTIIKHDSIIYPLLSIRGIIESNKIVKNMNEIVDKKDTLN